MERPPKYRRLWRIVAFAWDPVTFLGIFLGVVVAGNRGGTVAYAAAFFLAVYLTFLMLPASEAVKSEIYPLYLAYKVVRAETWRPYWYQKFRYRVLQSAKRRFRFGGAGLFLETRSIELAKELGRSLKDAEPSPRLTDLVKASRLRNRYLNMTLDQASDEWASAARARARSYAEARLQSKTPADALLRYLVGEYTEFTETVRKTIRDYKEVRFWDRIEAYPTWLNFIRWLLEFGIFLVALWYGIVLSGLP